MQPRRRKRRGLKMSAIKATVLYHDNCLDGFGAAWAACCKLGLEGKYLPVQYGQPVPWKELEGTIYIVDFCYKEKELEELLAYAERQHKVLTIIDHHKTTIDLFDSWQAAGKLSTVAANLKLVLDETHSGAVLTWMHFFPKVNIPKGLKLVEDRDLWKFALPETKAYCAGLAVVAKTFSLWCYYNLSLGIENLIESGELILQYQEQQLTRLEKNCYYTELTYSIGAVETTVEVLACNAPHEFAPELGNRLAKIAPSSIAMIWQYVPEHDVKSNKTLVYKQCSLRSKGNVDVEVIAKALGGGGHKNAAGYRQLVSWVVNEDKDRPYQKTIK